MFAATHDWKSFPENAPINGSPIIIGGVSKEGEWVEVIARFRPFNHDPVCRGNVSLSNHWCVHGFVTLSNFEGVKWTHWHHAPIPPNNKPVLLEIN